MQDGGAPNVLQITPETLQLNGTAQSILSEGDNRDKVFLIVMISFSLLR